MSTSTRELWTCPKCGVKLVSRNLWHSGWWIHRRHVTEPRQLDAAVQSWLRRSYRLMGMHGRLARKPAR